MIGYLRGRIVRRGDGMVVVEANGVGYEVALPPVVEAALPGNAGEGPVELFISFHATANQPRPLLIGFLHEVEQEFFERFITVDGVGPTKAVRAMVRQVHEIADAIERRDVDFLRRLPGIGSRTAEKVIAELHGKMGKYALLREAAAAPAAPQPDFKDEVIEVLVRQLGHRPAEARRMVEEALRRAPHLDSAEALFQEVYRLERGTSQ
ncbi:MAG: Holliday junction branch migration protein RuvA [Armatimonadota bacterium]|nr:Holliday junction branch migration protein RuvA [Armatimonadota bacterium]MDR7518043.1 Holliday junction branch migration protein RuvA [Armatimonadota bacterium]MDR7550505.1 Holliday junction branch migration protein RuvA [Armatimonadota bacterium]